MMTLLKLLMIRDTAPSRGDRLLVVASQPGQPIESTREIIRMMCLLQKMRTVNEIPIIKSRKKNKCSSRG
ncbi:hypothetical protein D3C71_1109660 [compost metagenome]